MIFAQRKYACNHCRMHFPSFRHNTIVAHCFTHFTIHSIIKFIRRKLILSDVNGGKKLCVRNDETSILSVSDTLNTCYAIYLAPSTNVVDRPFHKCNIMLLPFTELVQFEQNISSFITCSFNRTTLAHGIWLLQRALQPNKWSEKFTQHAYMAFI